MTPRQTDTLERQLRWAVSHGDHAGALMLAPRLRRARQVADPIKGCSVCGSDSHHVCNGEPWSELELSYRFGR
jgi:hypothetical protein